MPPSYLEQLKHWTKLVTQPKQRVRGADVGIKPGWSEAKPQDRQHKKLAEPAKRPIAARLQNVSR